MRNRIVYILMNHRKHRPQDLAEPAARLDPCSSAAWLDGWDARAGPALRGLRRDPLVSGVDPPVRRPAKWLTRVGWKRRGLVRATERPAE